MVVTEADSVVETEVASVAAIEVASVVDSAAVIEVVSVEDSEGAEAALLPVVVADSEDNEIHHECTISLGEVAKRTLKTSRGYF